MNIQIQGRHLVVNEVLRQHTELLMGRFARQFPTIRHSHVTLSSERQHYTVTIRVWSDGLDLRGEDEGGDIYTTLSRAAGKLERRLQKCTDRHYRFGNHHGQHASLRCPPDRPLVRPRLET